MLSPGALKNLDRFAAVFRRTVVGTRDYSSRGELIDQLVMAMEERRITHITYRSLQATEPATYDVYPLGMIHHRGSLYLVGWAPRRERVQHRKIDRIEDVEVTGLQFQHPQGFDLRGHLAKSFALFHGEGNVHVKVRFSPTVAHYVQEGRWHPSQKLSRQTDGSQVAEFDLSTTEKTKRWILSFGREAEVLDPEEVREAVVNKFESLRETYSRRARAPMPSTNEISDGIRKLSP
jgi:proteasome accessory factor B